MSEVEQNELPQTSGGYSVTLPMFEGPLDLLLHLCQKHELDILDIPIGFVTEKYLEYLAVMQLLNLDVASEYLVMAATLAHIKSKLLLPAPPPGQEDELGADEEDPREALIRRLLEYQKYKYAGEELASRGVAGRDVFLRGMPIEEAVHTGLPPLAQVPLFSLVEAFQTVLSKSNVKLSHDIVHERVTLADRINELVDILRVRRRVTFEELFEGLETRFDLVITFLALLEMTRLRMTRLFQESFETHIYIEFTAQVTADDADGVEAATGSLEGPEDFAATETSAVDAEAHGEQPAFDTETPPPSGDELGHDEALANGESVETSPFDTEAPPPMEPHMAAADTNEAGETTPLGTLPAPPPHATTAGAALDDSDRSTLLDAPRAEEPLDAASTDAVFDVEATEAGDATTSTTQDSFRGDGTSRDVPSGDENT